MSNNYQPPSSNLEEHSTNSQILRPRSVTIIAIIFLLLALIDFIFSVQTGIIYKTHSYDNTGAIISTGYKAELLWLILYAIGAGLMRGGKFARAMACLSGLILLIIPGIIFIYYLYNTDAKSYFDIKTCSRCGDTRYINNSFFFKGISCRKCSKTLDFKAS